MGEGSLRMISSWLSRRHALLGLGVLPILSGCGNADATPVAITVHRDAGCGCCEQWVNALRADGRFAVTMTDDPNMPEFKRQAGVPADLASCHTALVGAYVIEGHVPPNDIARLLASRPADVSGLAVPGMPMGSPGMEMADGRREAFDVIAFHPSGRRVYAHHAGES